MNILSSPVTLTGTVSGSPLSWTIQSWSMVSSAGDQVVYQGTATDATGAFSASVTTTLEFDGMVRFDYTLTPVRGSPTVTNLALVVPVSRSVAASFFQSTLQPWNDSNVSTWEKSGDVTSSGWSCAFASFFWLGDEDLGIEWFAEDSLNWTPSNSSEYLQVQVTSTAATLICHLADEARVISSPLSFTFGLMASPIRPRPYPCDMAADRIGVYTDPQQMVSTGVGNSAINILANPSDMVSSAGCVEADFRVDWNPQSPSVTTLPLLGVVNNLACEISACWTWNGTQGYLGLWQMTPTNGGLTQIAAVPVSLTQGTWHRLALNWGRTSNIYLDGAEELSATLSGNLPFWTTYAQWDIGGDGYITLARWRVSSAQRTSSQLQPGTSWVDDANTIQIEQLTSDPTPMNWCSNPVVGDPSTPAYLQGNWTYDPFNHWLWAGAAYTAGMSEIQAIAAIGEKHVVLFNWASMDGAAEDGVGQGTPYDPAAYTQCVQLCEMLGVGMIPYTPWGVGSGESWFNDYVYEMSFTDPSVAPVVGYTDADGSYYQGCPGSSRATLNLWQIDQIMQSGAGGVYLDGQCYPAMCGNPLHGDEVIDPLTDLPTQTVKIFEPARVYEGNVQAD